MSCAVGKGILCAGLVLSLCTSVCYAEPIYHGEETEGKKRIALTFDDGPHYKYTEEILDILSSEGISATFFTVGSNAERFPELIERELLDGHEVANHTYSHKNISKLTNEEIKNEIKSCEEILSEHEGYQPRLFRPVEGYATEESCKLIEELGYDVILWSVDTRDWAHSSVDNIVNNVLNNSVDGSIVLFHDFVSGDTPTPAALRILIPKLKELGFEFVTVSELVKAGADPRR